MQTFVGLPDIKKSFRYVFVSLALLLILSSTFKIVRAGEVAVVTRFGRVTGRILEPGPHLILPFVENITTYNTKKIIYETTTSDKQFGSMADYKDYPVDTNTEDGQQVNIFYTVRFSVDPTKAAWVAQNIGSEIDLVEKVVKTESRIWARNIPRRFSAENLYTGDGSLKVQNEIFDSLKPTFTNNGLILDSVGIREIQFTDQYVSAIEAKQIEAVKVETEKNKAEQAKYQKEGRITQAEGQAEEQRLQRETLSDQIIEKIRLDNQAKFIDKWNGQMPSVLGGQNTLLDISTFLK